MNESERIVVIQRMVQRTLANTVTTRAAQEIFASRLHDLEIKMSELSDAVQRVEDVTNAVLDFLQSNNVTALQQALADAQAALAAAQATDAADVAARDQALGDLAAANQAATDAAGAITEDMNRLNDAVQPPPTP